MTEQEQINQSSADARQAAIDKDQALLAEVHKQYPGLVTPVDPASSRSAYSPQASQAGAQTQANIGGVNTSAQEGSAGGLAGFFGGKKTVQQYTAQNVGQEGYDQNRAALLARMGDVSNMSNTTMQNVQLGPMAQAAGAQAAGGYINMSPQDQFRNQQMQLGSALMAQANGTGPSVAGAQLQQSTEQNLQAALAQTASMRGGNLGAAQYALGNARANIQQQAAQQLAQNRMQEQMNAQNMLGGVLAQGRGMDAGLAIQQAQLGQQNNQFNAGLETQNNQFNAGQTNAGVLQQGQMNQQTGMANLSANVQQDQFKQDLLNKLQGGQISLDQYNTQLKVQQNQFNAQLLAQQEAARQGVALGSAQMAGQAAGATASGIGTALGWLAA